MPGCRWPIGPRDLDDAGEAGERARDREGEQHQAIGAEAGKARGLRCGADQPDFESLDRAAEQDGRQHDDDERDHRSRHAGGGAVDQGRHGGDRIELCGGREVEAVRIAPGSAHQIVEHEIGDIDQHQAGQDLARAETHPAIAGISA